MFRYSYLVFGVASYFVMIRRMKKHSTQIISSVMQGNISRIMISNLDYNLTYIPFLSHPIKYLKEI